MLREKIETLLNHRYRNLARIRSMRRSHNLFVLNLVRAKQFGSYNGLVNRRIR